MTILCSTLLAVFMRMSEGKAKGKMTVLYMNYFTCIVLAASFTGVSSLFPKTEGFPITLLLGIITGIFYFILKYFNTANLIPSTISVTTSFVAVYLTFRRSPYFALAYASNDIVLIILWILASIYDAKYISVVVCFVAFLVNDIYGFVNWCKMKKRQNNN